MNKIAPLSENQYAYLQRSFDAWLNVAEGGKRGGKNVINALAFALCLEEHPNKLHLVAGVSVTTAILNVIDCDGFGLMNYFSGRCRLGEYKKRDALIVSTRTGEKFVLISGLGKAGEERKIKGNSYGMVYITEVNECHPAGIQECFDRTLASKNRKIFHDLNPKAEGHFYYTDILSVHEKKQRLNPAYGLNYGHFTIADNLSLTQKQVDDALSTYDHNSIWFSRDILGLRRQPEGLVYPMFNRGFHVVETEPRPYEQYYITIDYGTQNPCVFLLWGNVQGVHYLAKEFYHSGRDTKNQKTDKEYYDELLAFTADVPVKCIIIDPSAASFIALIRRDGKFVVRRADNAVLDGIRETATALRQGLLKFNDCAVNTIREFSMYFWDTKSSADKPIEANDHAMDAMRYYVKTLCIALPELKRIGL